MLDSKSVLARFALFLCVLTLPLLFSVKKAGESGKPSPRAAAASAEGNSEADLVWIPLMEVKGFKVEDDGNHTYRFIVLGKDDLPLSDKQLHQYSFVWDFGNGRYSVDHVPVVTFDEDVPDFVTLRATGLKEILDSDLRATMPHPRSENCGEPNLFPQRVNLRRGTIDYPDDSPSIKFMEPAHKPTPGMCIDYLVEISLPENCKYSGSIDLSSEFSDVSGLGLIKILSAKAAPDVKIEQPAASELHLEIPMGRAKTYTLWLHCQLASTVPLTSNLAWKAKAAFTVKPDRQSACHDINVMAKKTDAVEGSLDPSHLILEGPASKVTIGSMTRWIVEVENEGTSAVDFVEIVDVLPLEFNLDLLRTVKVIWKGKLIPVAKLDVEADTRTVTWLLHNDDKLQKGDLVQLYFEVPIQNSWDCPERKCSLRKKGLPARRLVHAVTTRIGEERVGKRVENTDLLVTCTNMHNDRRPKLDRFDWVPIAVYVATTVSFTVYIVTKAFKGN